MLHFTDERLMYVAERDKERGGGRQGENERERERARIFYIHWVTGLWRHLLSDKSSYCKEMAQ